MKLLLLSMELRKEIYLKKIGVVNHRMMFGQPTETNLLVKSAHDTISIYSPPTNTHTSAGNS